MGIPLNILRMIWFSSNKKDQGAALRFGNLSILLRKLLKTDRSVLFSRHYSFRFHYNHIIKVGGVLFGDIFVF